MGVKPSKVTNILAGDAKLYYRVAEGGGFTVATYDRVMGAVSAVWPEDVPWPSDVPRLPPGDVAEDRAEMIRSLIAAARAASAKGAAE